MLKTYLYLPDSLNKKLISTAKSQNKSKAEIIRLALEKGIVQVASQNDASAQVLLELTEIGKRHQLIGSRDSSVRMDETLWDKDWDKDE
jgi:predicted DNA-binding protein